MEVLFLLPAHVCVRFLFVQMPDPQGAHSMRARTRQDPQGSIVQV